MSCDPNLLIVPVFYVYPIFKLNLVNRNANACHGIAKAKGKAMAMTPDLSMATTMKAIMQL